MMTYDKKEQGVALLYVLGILALLIAMALAFMNSSIFDQRASAYGAAGISADQMAMSTIEKVIWAIQEGRPEISTAMPYSFMPNIHYSYNISSNVPGNSDIPKDGLSALTTVEYYDGNIAKYLFLWNPSSASDLDGDTDLYDQMKDVYDHIRWELHRVKVGERSSSDPIYRVIGRTAFVLIPSSGSQINPSDLVKKNVDEGATTPPEKRVGIDIDEISAQDIKNTSSYLDLTGSNAKFMNFASNTVPAVDPDNKMPDSGWNSFDEFVTTAIKANTIQASQVADFRTIAKRLFTFGNTKKNESYSMKYGTNNHEIHRFYLPGFIDSKKDGKGDTGNELTSNTKNRWEKTEVVSGEDQTVDKYILMDPGKTDAPTIDLTADINKWKDDEGKIQTAITNIIDGNNGSNANTVFGAGIPWLAAFGYQSSAAGGGIDPSLAALCTFQGASDEEKIAKWRRQIAANLIDYCDSNNIPTSNVPPGNLSGEGTPGSWGLSSHIPEYTGNERTPYLNEFQITTSYQGLSITTGAIEISASPQVIEYTRTATASFSTAGLRAEIINIYKDINNSDIIGKSPKVKLLCELSDEAFVIALDGETPKSHTFSLPSGGKFILEADGTKDWEMINDGYFVFPREADEPVPLIDLGSETEIKLTATATNTDYDALPGKCDFTLKFTLKITNAILEYDTGNVDYAKIDKELKFTAKNSTDGKIEYTITANKPSPGATVNDLTADPTTIHTFSVQTEDPRQNLNPDDWNIETNDYTTASNIGQINDKSDPSVVGDDRDLETVTDPASNGSSHLSTAYIRNAPMQSPWELGFIHRGKKWQTINLLNYDKDKAVDAIAIGSKYFIPGGGKYEDGDANILDQIKMTQFAQSPMKVNLKNGEKELLKALLTFRDLKGNTSLNLTDKSRNFNELIGTNTFDDSSNEITDIANYINTNSTEFITRARLAAKKDSLGVDCTDLAKLKTGLTKAAKEEIIGKIINLTDVYSGLQSFELIVLAQAIKNVGNPDGSVITISKSYYNSTGNLQGPVNIDSQLGKINMDSGKNTIADEILAQRKYRVKGVIESNGRVKIINIRTE